MLNCRRTNAEVVSQKAQDMLPEAEELAAIHPNVIISAHD